MKIAPQSRLLMLGDSVTDCGRARPLGERPADGLGHGYVALVDSLFGAALPARGIRVLNLGIGGDTIRDVAKRWTADVLVHRPQWLSVMIGINDVWRQFDPDPVKAAQAVPPEEYEKTYVRLISAIHADLHGLILMTPFYIQSDRKDPMRARMDEYGAIVKRLAGRLDALCVDTQAAFDHALAHVDFTQLAHDRVHPTKLGHAVLARAFLATVEFPVGPAGA